MNYDSRSTWDSGLDAGSIPARSILKINEITQLRVLEAVENHHILIGSWYYAIGLILPRHHKLKDFCCTF